jgi:hypothetical protein
MCIHKLVLHLQCDENGDGEVSYKEFHTWVINNQDEFEKFAGVLNILPDENQ